ncbi:MAG: hypothetical protein GY841_23920 [FCB group bacterium]|nr:hypothetical protein [FCB group bacterium]
MNRHIVIAITFFVLFCLTISWADVPQMISYQGHLTDDIGQPVNAILDITFRIYDDATAGNLKWSETQSVTVTEGGFSVMLGSINPILQDSLTTARDTTLLKLYLEVQISEDPVIMPRTQFGTVPFAGYAHGISGDIYTEPGALKVFPVSQGFDPGDAEVTISADSSGSMITLGGGDGWWGGIAITTDDNSAMMRGTPPGSTDPGFKLTAESSGSHFLIRDSTFYLNCDARTTTMRGRYPGTITQEDPLSEFSITADSTGASFQMRGGWHDFPTENPQALIAQSCDTSGPEMTMIDRDNEMVFDSSLWKADGFSMFHTEDGGENRDTTLLARTGLTYKVTLSDITYTYGPSGMFMIDPPAVRADDTVAYFTPDGLKIANGASDGYVMTSDVNGVGTWQAASGSGSSCWQCPGNFTYLTDIIDSVGIGTETPTAKLHVEGDAGGVAIRGVSDASGATVNAAAVAAINDDVGSGGIGLWAQSENRFAIFAYNNDDDATIFARNNGSGPVHNLAADGTGKAIVASAVSGDFISCLKWPENESRFDVDNVGNLFAAGKATIGPDHTNGGIYAFVAGENNTANGDYSTIGGGERNITDSIWSTVGGGRRNEATGEAAVVSGGRNNIADSTYCSITGGFSNTAAGYGTSISGGYGNSTSYNYSHVGGGHNNEVEASSSVIPGGESNYIYGDYSVIPGGAYDTLGGLAYYTMAFGKNVYVNSSYTTVFYDSLNSGRLGLNRDDHDGGILYPIHVGTNGVNGNGAYLSGGGMWTNGSSRDFKDNFQTIDSEELMTKISDMSIESWNYKESDERHIGPVAEDFVGAFDVGTVREDGSRDNQYLSYGDVAGVALAGVKELYKRNQELESEVAELKELVRQLVDKNR